MDSEIVVITWQEYHRIIVDLLLVCFIFAKFNTVLKNVEKGEYLIKTEKKCFAIFEQNSGTSRVLCCAYFVRTELMLAILAIFCLMPLDSYRVSSMFLYLYDIRMLSFETL